MHKICLVKNSSCNLDYIYCYITPEVKEARKIIYGWHRSLMFSALDPGPSRPGLSIGWGNCIVFFGKRLDLYVASLHTGVFEIGSSKLSGKLG